jgi:TonB family protein
LNEAVDRLIAERERLDHGLRGSLFASGLAHALLGGLALVAPLLLPHGPALRVADGFAVVLPRGGGGFPTATSPPAPAAQPTTAPPATLPPAPPAVLKPPAEAPRPRALPEPDSRRAPRRTELPPPEPLAPRGTKAAASGTGRGSATPGLEFAPAGPGVPEGTDSGGDWYLAGVQQKIWTTWHQQIRGGFTESIGVTFTILADGNVIDIRVTQPSTVTLLNLAAQRAILNAAPFGPLPREYGTNRKTLRAIFKPTS